MVVIVNKASILFITSNLNEIANFVHLNCVGTRKVLIFFATFFIFTGLVSCHKVAYGGFLWQSFVYKF